MLRLTLITLLVAAALADTSRNLRPPQRLQTPSVLKRAATGDDQNAQIEKLEQEVLPDGSYQFSYESSNGISVQEQGSFQATGEEEGIQSVQGGFGYASPEGEQIQLSYVADENGFHPQGSHLPTPPPIPDEILKSLEYNAAHPEEDESQNY